MTYETQTAIAAPPTTLEKVAAGAAHGSMLLGIPFVLPVGTLLFAMFVQPSPYVKHQSLQALVFHLVVSIVFGALLMGAAALGLLGFLMAAFSAVLSGDPEAVQTGLEVALPANWGLAMLLILLAGLFLAWASLMSLIATIKGFQGKPYRYPLIGGLFK